MGPFDIEGGFESPRVAGPCGVGAGKRGAAGFVEEGKSGVGEAELGIEGVQVGGEGGIGVGVDDGDGLTGAVGGG